MNVFKLYIFTLYVFSAVLLADTNLEILVFGEKGVGKSSLIKGVYENSHRSAIKSEFVSAELIVNLSKMTVVMRELNSFQEVEKTITPLIASGKKVLCVLIFDISNIRSFLEYVVQEEDLKNLANKSSLMMIGNKNDLEDDREITSLNALLFAKRVSSLYYETESKKPSGLIKPLMDFIEMEQVRRQSVPMRTSGKFYFSDYDYPFRRYMLLHQSHQEILNSLGQVDLEKLSQKCIKNLNYYKLCCRSQKELKDLQSCSYSFTLAANLSLFSEDINKILFESFSEKELSFLKLSLIRWGRHRNGMLESNHYKDMMEVLEIENDYIMLLRLVQKMFHLNLSEHASDFNRLHSEFEDLYEDSIERFQKCLRKEPTSSYIIKDIADERNVPGSRFFQHGGRFSLMGEIISKMTL